MIQEIHSVRVFLTDECPDSIDDMLYGDGSSLGPTFDKIQQEAIKCGGSFENWEPPSCDFAFPSKEAAMKFINNTKKKFKAQVDFQHIPRTEDRDKQGMRVYKELPENLLKRIAALTPTQKLNLRIQIQLLEDGDCLIAPPGEAEKFKEIEDFYRVTHLNMKCKVTGKVRSKIIVLRSATKIATPVMEKSFLTIDDYKRELNRAKQSGWRKSDLTYDAIINGCMIKEIENGTLNKKPFPELLYACDTCIVVVYDYNGEQFVGWYFFNENLDEPMNFTNYSV